MSDYRKIDTWRRRSQSFCIEILHYANDPTPTDYRGPHRWNVYAYIYPNHPRFAMFKEETLFSDAVNVPLHEGCSFVRAHVGLGGNVTSWQVGSDYNHLHDDRFANIERFDEAYKIIRDADRLFDFLKAEYDAHTVNTTHEPDGAIHSFIRAVKGGGDAK